MVRFRTLDRKLALGNCFTDVSITIREFQQAAFSCKNIIVTENQMNFLTLPQIQDTIAIWGGGFGIEKLKNIEWLKKINIYYWGNLDVHGMQILSQIRIYYPHVNALMMDTETLEAHTTHHVPGKATNSVRLLGLKESENELFNFLKEKNIRLEQEKIPQSYVLKVLEKVFL